MTFPHISKQTFDTVFAALHAGELQTQDIHTAVASYVLGIPAKDITPAQRMAAKSANYVWLYSNAVRLGDI